MTDAVYPELKLLIGGRWRDAAQSLPVLNPADETEIGRVPCAGPGEMEEAVRAAEKGLKAWRSVSPAERMRVLFRAADILRGMVKEAARAITLEQGKPLAQARGEIGRACDILEWDAAEGRRLYGRITPAEAGMRHITLRQPIGIVAAFTPWNFPIASPARKIAGALSAGCSIIIKPSEETPAGAFYLARALVEAGLPEGALNVVYGEAGPISEYLIGRPEVRMITFTGSVPVGKHLAAMAGAQVKPAIMELGGHGPVIVCEDADPEQAAEKSLMAKAMNAGQICVSPTRFIVAEPIFERFAEAMADRAAALRLGRGLDPATEMGPLANTRRRSAVDAIVREAEQLGARVLSGGRPQGNSGYFYPLTVLADVPRAARAMNDEPFGPVALINPAPSLEAAIAEANRLPFGLAAYAFTESARTARILSEEVDTGTLAINHLAPASPETPFGGVKDSGYGREGGAETLDAFTVVKHIAHFA